MENKLKIAIIGANGGIGIQTVNLALEAGHHVTAIVRNPDKITIRHPNLEIVSGDVMIPESFATYLPGIDVVISTIGRDATTPTTLFSAGTRNILDEMAKSGINRIFCISASAIEISPENPLYIRLAAKYIVQKIFGNNYADQRIMEAMLKASNINWTVMRPPRLSNGPLTKKYRYAVNRFLKNCLMISRVDVADFMIGHISDPETFQAIVEIAN